MLACQTQLSEQARNCLTPLLLLPRFIACLIAAPLAALRPRPPPRGCRLLPRAESSASTAASRTCSPPDDPLLPPYQRLKRDFGGNEIVLAVYHDEHLLDADGSGLERLAEISQRIETVPGVDDVLSLAKINDAPEAARKGQKPRRRPRPLSRQGQAGKARRFSIQNSKLAARFRELFAGYTHSADGRHGRRRLHAASRTPRGHRADDDADPRSETIADTRSTSFTDLPGRPRARRSRRRAGHGRRGLLPSWKKTAAGSAPGRRSCSACTILIFFRSLRWLVVPIAVVQWSLLITQALLVLSGLQLSMVSSMLTAIVTVVGVATVMHLIVHVRELRTPGPHAARRPADGRRSARRADRRRHPDRRRRLRLAVLVPPSSPSAISAR